VRAAALLAVAALAERGDHETVVSVGAHLEDEYSSVRIAALEALSMLGWQCQY